MVQAVTPIISTAVGIAATYGAGAVNVAAGVGLAAVARPSIQRAAAELAKYKALKNEIRAIKQAPEATAEDRDAILLDDVLVKEEPPKPKVEDTVDKIKSATQECFESSLISKQVDRVQGTYRAAQANQASLYAQAALGVSQVAVATSSIGHATLAVTNAAIGFSFISAAFYLGASIYGFANAQKQLWENEKRQQEVLQAIQSIKDKTRKTYEDTVSIDSDSGFDMVMQTEVDIDAAVVEQLKNTLVSLQTEAAFLSQQRAAQGIHAIAAMLSIVAIGLFTAGTNGVAPLIYYSFLFASIVLPFVAMGYSSRSMNETKYMKALQEQLNHSPLAWTAVNMNASIAAESFLALITPMLNLEIADPTTRETVNELFHNFIKDLESSNQEEQTKQLKELFEYLIKLQDNLIKEDLYCRLRITGMQPEDLDSEGIVQGRLTQET